MVKPEVEFRSDRQIATDFLSYLQSELSEQIVYELEPTRLTGGLDARLYRYKLVGQEPRVIRILRPAREVEELLHHQFVHQTLNQCGLSAPVIHRVSGDKSVVGGVFAVMDLLPGQPLAVQAPEIHATVLGESMARMHALDVQPFVDEFRRAGIPDENFLFPASLQKGLDFVEQTTPWSSELVGWLRNHLLSDGQDLSVIHGDYHGGNLMFQKGSVTGILDWALRISDPAIDLANMMNDYLLFANQIYPGVPHRLWREIVDGTLKAYQGIRPLNCERIKAFRVLHLLGVLFNAAHGPEFMRRPKSKCDYVAFIEQTTGLKVSPAA